MLDGSLAYVTLPSSQRRLEKQRGRRCKTAPIDRCKPLEHSPRFRIERQADVNLFAG
jgi:hypothetical protein